MRALIVTKSPQRRGRRGIEHAPPTRLAEVLPSLGPGDLLYLDLSSFTAAEARARLKQLLDRSDLFVGVIDPKGTVKDVPSLFHDGAVDYVDGAAWKAGIPPRRLGRAAAYARALKRYPDAADRAEPTARPGRPSGADWSRIREGEEYTFSLLFIELDGAEDLEQRFGAANLAEALASFHAYVERSVAPFGGRTWIWSRFGGIVLFPFDGRREQAAPCGLSMVLYKYLYDIEESRFPHFVSWRMAAHVGDVVWRERATGTLVSETLNSVFHLGQQFVPAGSFHVTDEIRQLAGDPMRKFFVPAGHYEGRRIWRMRRPLAPAPVTLAAARPPVAILRR
jgi:class 3 adenylate cyclase